MSVVRNALATTLYAVLLSGSAFAQMGLSQSDNRGYVGDVLKASYIADVQIGNEFLSALQQAAVEQPAAYREVFIDTNSAQRVARFADYFKAKALLKGMELGAPKSKFALGAADASDFHWKYLSSDFQFVPLKYDSLASIKLKLIDVAGTSFVFGESAAVPNWGIVVPTRGRSEARLDLHLQVDSRPVVWTGTAISVSLMAAPASTTQGCEIHVNSSPPGATVLFNGRPWHRKTNIRSIHEPGEHEVIVRMDGYKEWKARKSLSAGMSWVIDAVLSK